MCSVSIKITMETSSVVLILYQKAIGQAKQQVMSNFDANSRFPAKPTRIPGGRINFEIPLENSVGFA